MDCFSALDEARFPVICAIQGGCIGGALDLATACDIRLCSADAFFTACRRSTIGMAADLGVLQRLPKIVPQGVAREMAYTGERLGAERALAVGLVNAVLPDAAALLEHAMTLARSIAAKSPLAIAGSKLALNHARDHGDRGGAAADDAAAERDLRHRRDGDGDRRLEGEARADVRAAGRRRDGLSRSIRTAPPTRMLFRRREVLLPTPTGWLLLLAVVAIAATLLGRALPDLLTVDEPARGSDGRGAQTLVVEGWLEARDLDQALPAIRSGRYQRVLTTGGPIESWDDRSAWNSYAERAAEHLMRRGTDGLAVTAVAAPPTDQDRTYRSALTVREWTRAAGVGAGAIDVFTAGIHARRSRAIYRLAFGPAIDVGVIPAANRDDVRRWWTNSRGAKAVLGEALSLAWTTCCFWPERPAAAAQRPVAAPELLARRPGTGTLGG